MHLCNYIHRNNLGGRIIIKGRGTGKYHHRATVSVLSLASRFPASQLDHTGGAFAERNETRECASAGIYFLTLYLHQRSRRIPLEWSLSKPVGDLTHYRHQEPANGAGSALLCLVTVSRRASLDANGYLPTVSALLCLELSGATESLETQLSRLI